MRLHGFELFALGFVHQLGDEYKAYGGESRVNQVSRADADAVFANENGERPADQEVCTPLGEAANGDGDRTDAVVEHFAEHHPHHRTPCCSEECHVEVCREEGEDAAGAHEVAACIRTEEETAGESAERDSHTRRTDEQKRFTPNLVDEENRGDGHGQVDGAGNYAREECIAFAKTDALPKHGTVIEDDVDTHELLENGKAKTRPDNRGDAFFACYGFQKVRKLCRLVTLEGFLDFDGLFLDADASDKRKNLLGFCHAAFADKVTRRFWKLPGGNAVNKCRNRFDPEHHFPRIDAHNHVACRTRNTDDDVVRKQCHENADNDGELLHGTESPAQMCRGCFGNVDGCDDGCHTDTHTANHAPCDEIVDGEG